MPDADRLAQLDRAAVGLNLAREQPQERRFARAVAADDADAVRPQHAVGEVRKERPPVIPLRHVLERDDLFAEPARGRGQLHRAVALRRFLVFEGLIAVDALLALGAAGLAAAQDPFALDAQDRLPLALGRLGHLRALLAQLQIAGVIRLVVIELAARELRDVVHDALKKVPVVRHHDEPALIPPQPVLQPGDHLRVKVVRRLVEHQHVRRMDERRAQSRAAAFAAGERADAPVRLAEAELRQHRLCLVFVQRAELRRHAGEDLLQDRPVVVHLRVLRQIAHLQVRPARDVPAVRLHEPGQHLQKRRFAGAVDADDAGLVPLVEIKIHILQQLTAAEIDGKLFCG